MRAIEREEVCIVKKQTDILPRTKYGVPGTITVRPLAPRHKVIDWTARETPPKLFMANGLYT